MATTEVKGQICDGPIAEIVILGMFLLWCIHHYVLIVLCNFVLCNLMSLYACCTCAGKHVLVCV